MYKDSLEPLFNNPVLGYAHHQIILDEAGKPVDYKFLEVNPAFEKLTGLKREEILNRTVREVLPGIEKGKFDWIGYYGEIALGESEKHFEQFSEPLQKWYRVHAYSSGHMHFSVLFLDITSDYLIAEATKKFNEYQSDNVDYDDIARQMQLVSGAKYVALNIFDENRDFTTMGFAGLSPHLNKASSLVGYNISGKRWSHDPVREEKTRGQKTTFFENLRALTGDTLPWGTVEAIEKIGNTGAVVIIKTTKDHLPLGDFTLIYEEGSGLQNQKAAETLADVTGMLIDRINTEQKALESKNQFESLVTNIPGITYRCKLDSEWTMLFMSDAVDPLSGYPASDFIGNAVRSYESVIHPDDTDYVAESIHSAVAERHPWDIEYRICHKDGSIRWVHEKGSGVFAEDGSVEYLDGFILDVTERMQAKSELAQSEQRFDLAISGTGAGLWDWDMVNNIVFFSQRWKNMLGYEDHEVVNDFSGWQNLWHPDDAARIEQAVTDYLEGKTTVYEIEHRLRHKSGEWRWILTRGDIVRDPDGKPVRWVGTNIDLTKIKKVEEQARFLGTITENMSDSVLTTDTEFRINYINRRAEELYGYTLEDLMGQTPDLFNAEPLAAEIQAELYRTVLAGEVYQGESLNRRKDGTTFICEYSVMPLIDDKGKIQAYVGIQRDVTKQRAMQRQFEEQVEKQHILLDNIHTQVWYLTDDHTYGAVNKAHADFNGVKIEDLAFKDMYDIFPEDIVEVCRQANIEVFTSGKPVRTEEWVPHASGERRLISILKSPRLRADGTVEYVVCSAEDITERKLSEKALNERNLFIEKVLNSLPGTIVYIFDLIEQRNVYSSNEINDILGYSSEEFQAMGDSVLPMLIHPDDLQPLMKHLNLLKSCFKDEIISIEYRMKHRDGHWVWIENHDTIFSFDKSGKPLQTIGSAKDITERKQAEAAVEKSLEEKNVLLSEIHHRVKNNMAVISSLLTLQSEFCEQKKDPEKMLKDLQTRILSMSWVHELVYESKDFAQIQSVKLLQRLADHLKNSYCPDDKKILMQVHSDDIMLDMNNSVPLTLLIAEVLTNAWKHAFPGRRTGRIEVVLEKREKDFYLVIRDDGVGVADLDKLRQPDSFGYTIVHGLAQQLRGELSFSSPAEGGLQVEAWFPDTMTTKVP